MISPEFNLGPITIHLYGLIIGLALYSGWILAKQRAHLYKIPSKIFEDYLVILPLVLMLFGARIYHVADYWEVYKNNLASILLVTNGGLGIFGGLVGFFVGVYLFCRIKKINFVSLLDLIAPSLLLGQAIGRFGNYINQEGFGPPTNLPWGTFVDPQNRPSPFQNFSYFHPTFFYEALIDGVFFVILILASKRFKIPGQTFALYLILYSVGRFSVEFFRIDTAMVGSIRLAHILSITTFILGLILFIRGTISNGVDSR